jgi:hypothetical protein
LNFLERLSKNAQISNFTKLCPVRAEMLLVDRRKGTTKLKVACCNFANASDSGHFKQNKATGMKGGNLNNMDQLNNK